jgi:hypothetical protein
MHKTTSLERLGLTAMFVLWIYLVLYSLWLL